MMELDTYHVSAVNHNGSLKAMDGSGGNTAYIFNVDIAAIWFYLNASSLKKKGNVIGAFGSLNEKKQCLLCCRPPVVQPQPV